MNFEKFSNFDIFAKRIGLYYKKKEKIGSCFGLTLTIIYVFISLTIFIYYTVSVIKREDLQVHDSKEYSMGAPYINLNNSNLFYLAFGVENSVNASRFIDERIYRARAIFYYGEKDSAGAFNTVEYRDLKIEKCKVEKFGKEYQHLFTEGEFDNSYCVDNFDIALTGGFIYDKFSCIRLQIYPCVNKTENNNHCKPQEEIDQVLAGGYFSVLLKDIGLNPTNFSNPILPTIQDFYTTISKDFFKDVIFNYEITDVDTDYGIFNENKKKSRYLKFDKVKETFYLRDDDLYYKGKNICKVEIRLSDNIHVQRRSYKKMSSVFSTTGGYMQVLYSFFMLLSLIPNQFNFRKIIVNGLLNIEFKNDKRHLQSQFNPNHKHNPNNSNNSLNSHEFHKIVFIDKEKSQQSNNNLNEFEKIKLEKNDNKANGLKNKIKEIMKEKPTKNFKIPEKKENIIFSSEKEKDLSSIDIKNISKIEMMPKKVELKIINPDKASVSQSNNYLFNYPKDVSFFNRAQEKKIKEIKLNIFDYYCIGKFFNKTKKVELFNKGCLLFAEEMDIIHIFRHLLDIEKTVKEKNNIKQDIKILSKQSIA